MVLHFYQSQRIALQSRNFFYDYLLQEVTESKESLMTEESSKLIIIYN